MPKNNQDPYLLNPQTGRKYYGKALGLRNSEELWTDRPYQSGYETSHPYSSRIGTLAGIGAAYGIARKFPSVWDHATQISRIVEDYSPFKWGRTFQVSNILSHREKAVMQAQAGAGSFFELKKLRGDRTAEYLSGLSDSRISSGVIQGEGVTFRQGKLYLGDVTGGVTSNSKVLLKHAGVIRLTEQDAGNAIGEAYARANVPGFRTSRQAFGKLEDAVKTKKPAIGGAPIQFIGGKTALQYHLRRAKAIGTEFGIYRFNRLLSEDFTTHAATKWAADYLKKIPAFGKYFDTGLGVQATTPLKTAFNLGKKLTILGGVLPLAYKQADWMAEKVTGMGLTEAGATGYVAGRLGYAHALNFLTVGLAYDAQEAAENWVPGITDPLNVLKFGLTSGIAGMTVAGAYTKFQGLARATEPGYEGFTKSRAEVHMRHVEFAFGDDHHIGKFFEKLGTNRPGSLYKEENLLGAFWRNFTQRTETGILDLNLGKIKLGRATVGKLGGLIATIASSPLWIPGVAGFFVPDERPEELEAIYSGKQEVPVKRGRFWEFGRGSYEGDDIMYYRPHWYSRMKSKYKEKSIWQDDYDLSPLKKFYLKEFTYHLEDKHYNSRPYPITSLPFEDVPFIGPVISNTLGRLIKPPMYMHSEEWRSDGAVKVEEPSFGKRFATELGETPGGLPVSPYGFTQSISRAFYNLTEQAGLWGYGIESGIDRLTGTPGIFDQYKVMSSFRDVTSASRDFYDLNLGGMGMTNEAFRRLYPAKRAHIDTYNPLSNEMPSWIPGGGSRGINFHEGDPYTKIPEGELRLPGAGYGARFSEVAGVDPEDYPLIHKYKILADISPYSQEFINISSQLKQASGSFDSYEQSIYESTKEQLQVKKERIRFSEYRNSVFGQGDKYGSSYSSEVLSEINRVIGARDETTGVMGALGSIFESALHLQSPFEYLYPLSPESKFNPRRSAIENYERDEVYGRTSAFWNKPFDDFIAPAVKASAHEWLGWDGIPGSIEKTRNIEEYFDKIKYVKYSRLVNIARLNRDEEAKRIFEKKKDETLFGVNPYTQNESSIYRALPAKDRAYFRAFSEADSPEKRERILELVPRNQRSLYLARWKLEHTKDLREARNAMLGEMTQANVISDRINDTYAEARDEGFPRTPELYQMYMHTKYQGESYSDWYRRTQLLPDVMLPESDWIGWHPSVDLEDVKLKMVVDMGENMHDYGFYDTQLRTLGSKPFLDDAVEGLVNAPVGNSYQARRNINEIFSSRRIDSDIGVSKQWGPGSRPHISLDLE